MSPNDMTTLATDRGPVPMNIGAVLMLGDAVKVDLATVRAALAARIPGVRRLRQRMVRPPFGCGRPYWVDDPDFDLARHVSEAAPAAGGSVLDVASSLVCTRLDPGGPLWAARWVPGADASLILVMHHALADGIGGLAVLAALSDGFPLDRTGDFPQPPPRRSELLVDAVRGHASAVGRLPATLRQGWNGWRELRTSERRGLAEPTSLNRPTGSRRRLTTVELTLADVVDAAHRRTCTVNDVVLAAVTGALVTSLRQRGEHPTQLVISVPISARRAGEGGELGNQVGAVPVAVATTSDRESRLRRIAATTNAARSGKRGTSAGPLSVAFRALGALRLAQPFIDHQRLVHTFETNVRGPEGAFTFAGHRVDRVIPIAVNPGNVGVSFDVLSYAGRLVVTVVADPDIVPDQDSLTAALTDEFAAFTDA